MDNYLVIIPLALACIFAIIAIALFSMKCEKLEKQNKILEEKLKNMK
jgi:hypothetical protein